MNRNAAFRGSPQMFTDAAPAPRRARVAWIDLFRGAAVLVMIETHVVNTFLASILREGGWFAWLNYINGLVAPSFLFIAGFVQGMERRRSPGKPVQYGRRASRLLGIAALGYAMHFPVMQVLRREWWDALKIGSQVDVLQCLSLGLGVLLGIAWLVQRFAGNAARYWTAGVFAVMSAVVLAAPLAPQWTGGPVILAAWLNRATGSLFPIFPWLGFVFLGALMGAWPERALLRRVLPIAGLAALAWVSRGTEFSAVSPSFFLERAAWVALLAVICEWVVVHQPMPAFVLHAGKHSLKFYVVHLALISALAGAGFLLPTLQWPAIVLVIPAVVAVTFGGVWFLERLPQMAAAAKSALATRFGRGEVVPEGEVEDLPNAAA